MEDKEPGAAVDKTQPKPKAYTIKYKRPRSSRACMVCRTRKVRCDAEIHIPCTNCITFGCDCVLLENRKKLLSDKPAKKIKKESGDSPDPRENDSDNIQSSNNHQSSKPVLAGISGPVSEAIHNISQVSVPPSLTLTYKNRPLMHKREMLSASNPPRASLTFVGHSSISLMAQKVGQNHLELADDLFEASDNSPLDSVELEILKLRGAFLLPPHDLAVDIIELYFEHVHPLMPVINRTEFMAKFNDPNDSPSLMLLQAVLLCGCRVSNNPLLVDSKGLTYLASLTFYRRAKALYETNFESDPVSIIQTVLLIGSFWEGPEDVTRNSYYWTRVGVGLAQGFGFHRDISASTTVPNNEKKIWRRIWWCLFEKDRNVAIAFGRPTSIDLTDSDVPMLTLDDFDESDPELGIESPYPINETQALYFIHLVKLAEITGIIIKHQYTVKAELMKRVNKFSIIQRCDMLMGIWFNNLPEELQFSLTDHSKQNFYACLLNAQYYNRLYLVHRANLLRMARSSSTNLNNYKYPSWGISFQAAWMISLISKILLDKGLIKYCPVMFVYILFSSLIMLIYHIDSLNPHIASAASDSSFISRGVLKEMGKYWQIVGVLLKLFDKYANSKIKRAQVIEKGTIIAELQERRSSSHAATGMGNPSKPSGSPSLMATGISPHSHEFHQNTGPVATNNDDQPLEDLVRQYKQKGDHKNSPEDNRENPVGQSNATTDQTPSSLHSFPDISLVTEKLAPTNNFLENFEPTQLFPTVFQSIPVSRAETPFNDLKRDEDFLDNPNGFHHDAGPSNDIFTNFVDSSYINMNLQTHVENDGYFLDEMSQMFNMQS